MPNARTSPDWVLSAVIYEVNTRNFSEAGNFDGVTTRLEELARLGVTVIWLMPVHPIGVDRRKGTYGSPYSVRDFYAIDANFGDAFDLKRLVTWAHTLGLKVIIDIVANHTSWDSVMMTRPEFYKHNADGQVISPEPDWTDVAALNYANKDLRRYMIDMLEYWIREFHLDGFRCDVAGYVPTDFWNEARAALNHLNRSLFLLAEWHSGDLLEHAFDAGYAWPFHKTLNAVLLNGAPASKLRDSWMEENKALPGGGLELRFTDNHDERRALARFGEKATLTASFLMFALDGIPLLYNGQEAGDTTESGAPALFDRLPIYWPNATRRPNFRPFYEKLIALRKENAALQQGRVKWLPNDSPNSLLTFERREKDQAISVSVNLSSTPVGDLPAWGARAVDARDGRVLLELR